MRIHYLQHVWFEGLGNIADWAQQNAHEVAATRLFAGESLPNLNEFDFLIVLGGAMNVYQESEFSFLKSEKQFIESAIGARKKVLGICLGAQLIADVMGARVRKNEFDEIGWFPIQITDEAKKLNNLLSLPDSFQTFHWHGDAFDLPAGARGLASSEACANQAFAVGDNVLGVQFHPEATLEAVRLMVENDGDELQPARFVQTAAEIVSPANPFAENARVFHSLLDNFVFG